MNITLEYTDAAKHIDQLTKILWKRYAKKAMLFFILFYGVGLWSFIMGMTAFSSYNKSVYMEKSISYTNWHLSESFGLVIILITSYVLYLYFRNRSNYFKTSKRVIDRHLISENKIVVNINENAVTYKSAHLNSELKWPLFIHYTILNNYILLYTDQTILSSIAIDKNLLTDTDLTLFNNFINSRLFCKP